MHLSFEILNGAGGWTVVCHVTLFGSKVDVCMCVTAVENEV